MYRWAVRAVTLTLTARYRTLLSHLILMSVTADKHLPATTMSRICEKLHFRLCVTASLSCSSTVLLLWCFRRIGHFSAHCCLSQAGIRLQVFLVWQGNPPISHLYSPDLQRERQILVLQIWGAEPNWMTVLGSACEGSNPRCFNSCRLSSF